MNLLKFISFLGLLLIIVSFSLSSQSLQFSYVTVADEGQFAPRHVLAIWIEDDNGNFVKTLKVMGTKRKRYLFKWNAKSEGNVVDAFTGATMTSHTSDTIFWNCRDLSQKIVPDGKYNLVIEFADDNSHGPNFIIKFNKSNDAERLVIKDQTYFMNMILVFTPII